MQVSAIAAEKARQQEQYYHEKYSHIYDIVVGYLKTQDVYMYGGSALDQYMPAKHKIYSMYQLPDVDVFSSDPDKIAAGLIEVLHRNGLMASKQSAYHQGTLTVFCKGLKVVDISYMPIEYSQRLAVSKRGALGIKLVSMEFIRFTLHTMLATSSPQRWEKVMTRLAAVYKVFPNTKPVWSKYVVRMSDYARDIMAVNEAIHVFTETSPTRPILLGTPVISMMVDRAINSIHLVPYNVLIVPGNIVAYARSVMKSIPGAAIMTMEQHDAPPDFLMQPPYVTIRYGNVVVAIIFQASLKCFAYNEVKGRNVGTIHTMLMFYYSMFLSIDETFIPMRPAVECIIHALSAVCKRTMTHPPTKNKKLLNQLSVKCMGYEEGIVTMRRNHFKAR